jgi:hypothetical protein
MLLSRIKSADRDCGCDRDSDWVKGGGEDEFGGCSRAVVVDGPESFSLSAVE